MASQQQQVYTLEAVNAMVPRLKEIVGRQLDRRRGIEARLKALSQLVGEVPDEIRPPEPSDPQEVRALKRELVARIAEYHDGWRDLEKLGAVLKDPRIGLVDFYGTVDGKLVWLCWKYGEAEVTHYHGLDEGYAGRKAIGATMKQRLLN